MKIYININQRAFSNISKETGVKLDLIDATIFEYIYKFSLSSKVLKKLINNRVYSWVSYGKIIEDNPLININSKDAIARRIKKLCEANILSKETIKEDGNKVYFSVTDLAFQTIIEGQNVPTQEQMTTDSKVGRVSTQKSEGVPTQKSDNSILIDSKLNREKKHIKRKNQSDENSQSDEKGCVLDSSINSYQQRKEENQTDTENLNNQMDSNLEGKKETDNQMEINNQDIGTTKEKKISPADILNYYKMNVSQSQSKIKEMKSFNALLLKIDQLELILNGLMNYAQKNKKTEERYKISLQNFILDKTYLDYQQAVQPKAKKGSIRCY
jgi:hypothetical protein